MRIRPFVGAALAVAFGTLPFPAFAADNGSRATQIDALRAQIEALAQRQAGEQRDLRTLRAQLEALTASSPEAPGTPVPAAPPAAPAAAAAPAASPTPIASTPRRKKPATDESVSTIYRQQNALFSRRLTITPSLSQIYSDSQYFTLNGFLALGAIFLGNANVTQQQSNITLLNLNTTYGLSNRIQFEANIPYYARETSFTSVGALGGSTSASTEDQVRTDAFGDINAGAFYQLQPETPEKPSIVLNAHVYVPTGIGPYGIALIASPQNNNVVYPAQLPTGQGVVGYEAGVSFLKTVDPAIIFGGLNYYSYQRRHFDNIGTDPTAPIPGSAQPGEAFAFQLGTAFSLNESTSLSFSFQDSITQATLLGSDGGPMQTVVGSQTNAAMLTIGTSVATSDRQTVVTELGIGLTHDAPNFQFDVRTPTRF